MNQDNNENVGLASLGIAAGDKVQIDGKEVAEVAKVSPEVKVASPEELEKILRALKSAQATNYKHRMQGVAGTAKPKVSKHWYNGELISKADFDKLTWEQVHASNNIIRK